MKKHKCYVHVSSDGYCSGVALHSVNGSSPTHQSYWYDENPEDWTVDTYMLTTESIRVLADNGYTYAWSTLGLDEPDEWPVVELGDGYRAMSYIIVNGTMKRQNVAAWDNFADNI